MAEDRRKQGGLDRNRINLQQPHEVRFWMQELHVEEAALREAVALVGTRADTVRRHLEQHRLARARRPARPSRPVRDKN